MWVRVWAVFEVSPCLRRWKSAGAALSRAGEPHGARSRPLRPPKLAGVKQGEVVGSVRARAEDHDLLEWVVAPRACFASPFTGQELQPRHKRRPSPRPRLLRTRPTRRRGLPALERRRSRPRNWGGQGRGFRAVTACGRGPRYLSSAVAPTGRPGGLDHVPRPFARLS